MVYMLSSGEGVAHTHTSNSSRCLSTLKFITLTIFQYACSHSSFWPPSSKSSFPDDLTSQTYRDTPSSLAYHHAAGYLNIKCQCLRQCWRKQRQPGGRLFNPCATTRPTTRRPWPLTDGPEVLSLQALVEICVVRVAKAIFSPEQFQGANANLPKHSAG